MMQYRPLYLLVTRALQTPKCRQSRRAYFNQWKMRTPTGYPTGKFVRPRYFMRWRPDGQLDEFWYDNCTIAVVASKQYPLTSFFELDAVMDGAVYLNQMTPSDAAARDLDGRITARAAAMPPIELPPDFSPSDPVEDYIQAINSALVMQPGLPERDLWHGLTNIGQVYKYKFINVQDGKTYWIYLNDTITVKFANGYTLRLKFLDPNGSLRYQEVEGSLRDENGRDPNNPAPNTGSLPSNAQSFVYSYGGNTITISYVPVTYSVPASRLNREGIVTIIQIQGTDDEERLE
jgi:hypothetical protein